MTEAPRVLFERYRIEQRIAAGSTGLVYSATDTRTGEDVVVKLFPDLGLGAARGAWAKEMKLAFRLRHPNIVRCLDAGYPGSDEEDSMLVFERISGGSLRRRLVEGDAMKEEEVRSLLQDVGAALAFAHRRGVIHRDVKPENILREDERWLLTDFGSGRHLAAASAATVIGSLGYIAPETFMNRTVFASDQFGLGITAWECLGHDRPSDQERARIWLDGRRRTDLQGVISVMMAGHPERRWPHMNAVLALLGPAELRDFATRGEELFLLRGRSVSVVGPDTERVLWRGGRARRFCHFLGEEPILAGERRIVDLGRDEPDTLYVRDDSFDVMAASRTHARALIRDEASIHLVGFSDTKPPRSWSLGEVETKRMVRGLFVGPEAVLFVNPGDRRALHVDLGQPRLRPREVLLALPFVEAFQLDEPVLLCGDTDRTELVRPVLGPDRGEQVHFSPDHVKVVQTASGPSLEIVPPLAQSDFEGEQKP